MIPVIKEGGTSRIFDNITTLETPLQNSGTCIWVPEIGTRLITKRITKNGIYNAAADDAYGYSSVTVDVETVSGITGTGSDGKQHTVYSDQTTGQLVDRLAPVSIAVTTPPSYVGPYGQGAYIGFDGIVVHAYDSSGADMGAVPFNELSFPVTVARYDPNAQAYGGQASSALDTTPINQPIPYVTGHILFDDDGGTREYAVTWEFSDDGIIKAFGRDNSNRPFVLLATDEGGKQCVYITTKKKTGESYDNTHSLDRSYTYNGKTVYFSASSTMGMSYDIYANTPDTMLINNGSPVNISSSNENVMAWTIVYGSSTPSGGVQIPVEWQRPGDGIVLSTSFGIDIVPPMSSD